MTQLSLYSYHSTIFKVIWALCILAMEQVSEHDYEM